MSGVMNLEKWHLWYVRRCLIAVHSDEATDVECGGRSLSLSDEGLSITTTFSYQSYRYTEMKPRKGRSCIRGKIKEKNWMNE